MRKLFVTTNLLLSFALISPAFAASWTDAVTADIAKGNYGAIDQVVAANPGDAGAISAFLLQQAQNQSNDPAKAIALFNAAVPLAGQLPPGDDAGAVGNVKALVALASNPEFQKTDPKGAAQIFADALNILSLPNVAQQDPALRGIVSAKADDLLKSHPDLDDGKLKDEVSLAQGSDLNGVNPDPDTTRFIERGGVITHDAPPPPPFTPVIPAASPE